MEGLQKSIEVVIHKSSQSNSKLTSNKESTPLNFNYKQIYGSKMQSTSPQQHIYYSNTSKNDISRFHQMGETSKSQQNTNKKIIFKKQQQIRHSHQDSLVLSSKRMRKSASPIKKVNAIINSDLAHFGPIGQKQSQINEQNQKSYYSENVKQQQDVKDTQLLNPYNIVIPSENVKMFSVDNSRELRNDFSNIGRQSPAIFLESGTQESQQQKLGLFENRYENDGGSPYIYNSKIELQEHNKQHFYPPQHHTNNSITPLGQPIYQPQQENQGRTQGEKILVFEKVRDDLLMPESRLHEQSEIEEYNNQAQQVNFRDLNGANHSELFDDQSFVVFEQNLDDGQLQNNNINNNQNKEVIVSPLNRTKTSLQKQIQELRNEAVASQMYKLDSGPIRTQSTEEQRLITNRLKKNREMQLQNFCLQGTNIKTLSQKISEAIFKQANNQIFGQDLNLNNQQQKHVVQIIESICGSDALISSNFALGGTSNPITFLQDKQSLLSLSLQNYSELNNRIMKELSSKGILNSDIYYHIDNDEQYSPKQQSQMSRPDNMILQNKYNNRSSQISRRIASNEQSKAILNQLNDTQHNESVIVMNQAKYYSPTPVENSKQNTIFFNDKLDSSRGLSVNNPDHNLSLGDTQMLILNSQQNLMAVEVNQLSQRSNSNNYQAPKKIAEKTSSNQNSQAITQRQNKWIVSSQAQFDHRIQDYQPKSYKNHYSSGGTLKAKKTLDDSERTSYKITRPINFQDSVQIATPNINGNQTLLSPDNSNQIISQQDLDDYKMAKSYSKMMKAIGDNLKCVGPKSLKNLGYIQSKKLLPHNSELLYDLRGSLPYSTQGKNQKDMFVNITASVSTASFKGDNTNTNTNNHKNYYNIKDDYQGNSLTHNNSTIRIKQFQGGSNIVNNGEIQQKFAEQNMDEHYQIYQENKNFKDSRYKMQHMNSSKQIFQEQDSANILLRKNSRLAQRMGVMKKSSLQNSFIHQNRKLIGWSQPSTSIQASFVYKEPESINTSKPQLYGILNNTKSKNYRPQSSGINIQSTTNQQSSTNIYSHNSTAKILNQQSNTGIINSHRGDLQQTENQQFKVAVTMNKAQRPLTAIPIQQNQRNEKSQENNVYSKCQSTKQYNNVITPISNNSNANKANTIHKNANFSQGPRSTISSNKLQIFKKLKKGNVFKDQDFEAKQPNNNGIKLISLY